VIDAGVDQSPGLRSMIITGRFKACDNRKVESLQPLNEAVVLGALVQHDKTPSPGRPGTCIRKSLRFLKMSITTSTASCAIE